MRSLVSLTLTILLCAAGALRAQTATVTFDLVNVMLLPDISHPLATTPSQMTGSFVWTYTPGDFANGTGQWISYSIPWWTSTATVVETIGVDGLEWSLAGNFHSLGLDVNLKTMVDLDPFQPSPLDLVNSSFQVEVGLVNQGHVVSGSIVPRCPVPQTYGVGTAGAGGIVPQLAASGGEPSLGNSSFTLVGSGLLGGTACIAAVATQSAQLPVLGMQLLVDPSSAVTALTTASGTAGVPGAGFAAVPVAIPNVPSLVGSEYFTQLLALDPGTANGFVAATNGLSLFVCH